MHAKELAVAPPFRRLLDAEIVVASQLDTDELGTFSGEVPRPDALVETCAIKAELAFRSLDVDCAIANEGSYGPIDAVPLVPSGIEIMAFLDRKRGIRIIETLSTHRTNWRLLRFKAGDPNIPKAVKAIGFPHYGVFVLCSSDMEPSDQERPVHPGRRRLGHEPGSQALRGRHGRADRRHARPSQPHAHARPARAVVEARQAAGAALPEMPRAGLRLDRQPPRPALRGLRQAHPLGAFRDRWLLGLRPRRGAATQGWAEDGGEAVVRELQSQALRGA